MGTAARPDRKRVYKNMLIDSSRWDGFRPRPGDIIISTPPKTGTTWTQMICALLIFQSRDFPDLLSSISPWLDFGISPLPKVLATLEGQTHRRFIKTHTPLDGLPYYEEVTYLCVGRDPRDAFLSMVNHFHNFDPRILAGAIPAGDSAPLPPPLPAAGEADLRAGFRHWIADDGLPWQPDSMPGASSVIHHVATFWEHRALPNLHFLHYSDLERDLAGEMKRLAGLLGIEVQKELWPSLVEAASFQSMKERAEVLAPDGDKGIWRDNARFFNKGASGQWRGILGDEELALYRQALDTRLEPALAEWLERGRTAES